MASFNDTLDLERAFLKAVTSSAIMARTYLHQAKEEMFTSTQRQFIFALAGIALNESNTLLTKPVYEYEVGSRVPDNDSASYIGEWNLIDGMTSFDSPEAILAKLKDADTGRKALKVSEEVVELLSKGSIHDAVSYLKREAMLIGGDGKQDRPMVNLTDISARMTLIRDKQQYPEKYQGMKIGLKTFDDETGGLFPGELTLIAGITGLGKSTLCRQIAKGIVTLNGAKNVLHIANEEYLEQVQYKYDAVFTGIPYNDFKFARISDEALDRWQKFMQQDMQAAGRGQIFVKEVAAFTDVSLMEQQFRILENRGIPIHAIIIDHLPHVKPIQQAWGENDERAKAAADCKELARWLRLPVITPTQAATEVEKKTTQGKRAGKLDVYGSKGQIHVANTFLIITYKGTDDTQVDLPDYARDVFWLCDAKKNRDGAPFYFMAKHYVRFGKVEEIADPSKKPTKEADKEAEKALQEAEKAGKATTAPTPAPAVPGASQAVPGASQAVPAVNTGLRDASMEFAEAIEGGGEEDEEEVKAPALSAVEDQDINLALGDALGEGQAIPAGSSDGPPIVPSAAEIEAERVTRAAEAMRVPKTVLDRIRAAKNRRVGV